MYQLKWFYPGLKVKRWILLASIGVTLIGVGLGGIVDSSLLPFIRSGFFKAYAKWVDRSSSSVVLIGTAFIVAGALLTSFGVKKTISSILTAILPEKNGPLIDRLYKRRYLEKGQQIVAIGGGTGLSTLLRGLKNYTSNITAIVTVADDGGSSGILRRDMGVLPPGDIRNCLVALADTEGLMENLFKHRYKDGDFSGHSFGNLFIATLSEVAGDFETAVKVSSKVLAIRGQVLPSTLSDVTLKATMDDGTIVRGESAIPKSGRRIRRVELEPGDPCPLDESIESIQRADAIILGPGSLYTSVIPNLLVKGIADAIRRSRAPKIYICNVMTQQGETDGYTVYDHITAINRHVGKGLIDYVLVNVEPVPSHLLDRYKSQGAEAVVVDSEKLSSEGYALIERNLISLTEVVRHDPAKLANAVIDLVATSRIRRDGLAQLLK